MNESKVSLTNKEISENFRDKVFYLMLGDFTGAIAYWLAANQHRADINIDKPTKAFSDYLQRKYFKTADTVRDFTYDQLSDLLSEDVFIAMPEFWELNQISSKDSYDLGALSRNVFYMICRQQITQPL